ncbi:hypothetical protein ACR3I8_00745 [Priestia flexa]
MKKRVWLTVAVLMACTVFLFMKLSTEEKVGYVYKKGKPYLDMTTESPAYNSVYSPIDRQLQLVVADNVYTFIENVPVVQINNELVPLAKKTFLFKTTELFCQHHFWKNMNLATLK